ncbi:MAG: Single-stranded D-binding protein [Firmicutes bacterium]|nr:Single-stranded D-binding protein [Bacillota bacterium]
MQMNQNENRAILRGVVEETPSFSHKVHGIDFYRFPLCVPRLSGREDRLNIMLPQPLLDSCPLSPGLFVEVLGEVRSFNNRSGSGSRLVITLYAKTLSPSEEEPCNQVFLNGVLCKKPILRRTPLGRDICDLLLAVNRKYRRADYLPCIAWGSLAAFCSQLEVGDPIRLEGRLQSRVYTKSTGEDSIERTAFELSIMSLAIPAEDAD